MSEKHPYGYSEITFDKTSPDSVNQLMRRLSEDSLSNLPSKTNDVMTEQMAQLILKTPKYVPLSEKYRKALETISKIQIDTHTEEGITNAIESLYWAVHMAQEVLRGGTEK
jgi:hypothetical protein